MPHVTLPNGDKMPMIGMGTFTGTRNTAKAQGGTMYENTKVCWHNCMLQHRMHACEVCSAA